MRSPARAFADPLASNTNASVPSITSRSRNPRPGSQASTSWKLNGARPHTSMYRAATGSSRRPILRTYACAAVVPRAGSGTSVVSGSGSQSYRNHGMKSWMCGVSGSNPSSSSQSRELGPRLVEGGATEVRHRRFQDAHAEVVDRAADAPPRQLLRRDRLLRGAGSSACTSCRCRRGRDRCGRCRGLTAARPSASGATARPVSS